MNIILIGMPGVGKSTLGVILAKQLGYDFVDADIVIQHREKKRLSDIIAQEGIDAFLKLENDVCCSLADISDAVIATGGSAVYGTEAMELFSKKGTVVYLKASYNTLCRRLRDLKGRGVVLRDGQTLEDIYEERTKLYEKYAGLVIDEDGKNLEQTLDAVLEAVSEIH